MSRSEHLPEAQAREPEPVSESQAEPSFRIGRTPAVCALLVYAVVLVFGQSAWFGFVNFDDPAYVYNNTTIQHGITANGIVYAFTHIHGGNWHPLTSLSHLLDCEIFSGWAGGPHLVNVFLHAATAVVLLLLLRSMTGRLWASALAAAIFALHPLRAESVAWISERKDVLSGLLFMLTLWAYVVYTRQKDDRAPRRIAEEGQEPSESTRRFPIASYLLVVALIVLGLLAKPMLVTLPFVFLLLDYWPLGRFASPPSSSNPDAREPRRLLALLVEKIPFFILALTASVATFLVQRSAMVAMKDASLPSRLENAAVSYVVYLVETICPVGLNAFYVHPGNSISAWKAAVSVAILIAITIAVVALRAKRPYLLMAWLWYLGMLVPVIGIVQVGEQARADRYTYLPEIGLAIALAWALTELAESRPGSRLALAVASGVGVAVLAGLCWRQTTFWRDSETLWRRALACDDLDTMAHFGLGNDFISRKLFNDADAEFARAIELKPDFHAGYMSRGNVAEISNRPRDAERLFKKAIEIKPDFAEVYVNLANLLASQKRYDEAFSDYRKAIELNPDRVEAWTDYGKATMGAGNPRKAAELFESALKLDSDNQIALEWLPVALAAQGMPDKAVPYLQKALQAKPDSVGLHRNLASALVASGQIDQGLGELIRASELEPENADLHFQLGVLLSKNNQTSEGMAEYRRAIEIDPRNAEYRINYGVGLSVTGRVDQAIEQWRASLAIRPDIAGTHNNLATALANKRNLAEALAEWRKASRLEPSNASILNNMAWILATNPDPKLRDGKEAVQLAEKSLKLIGGSDPATLDTLAAAYAEAGRYAEAVKTAEKAASLASRQNNARLAASLKSRIDLYRTAKPWRDSPR